MLEIAKIKIKQPSDHRERSDQSANSCVKSYAPCFKVDVLHLSFLELFMLNKPCLGHYT